MPIYEFECKNSKCRNIEVLKCSINDKPIVFCKKCNSECKRIISETTFILKGTGWYETDYKNNKKVPTTGEKK